MKSKSKMILIIALLLILLAVFLSTGKCENSPTGNIIAVDSLDSLDDSVDVQDEPEEYSNGSGQPLVYGGDDGYDDGEDYDYQQYSRPYCGDGRCEGRENCGSCQEDCGCQDPASCVDGECILVECFSDEDCIDDNPCTEDVCYFAGHRNAYCSRELITARTFNDGCCPEGAWVDTDSDCEPVCGNGHCEYGEHTADCREDCLNAGPSGGGDSGASSQRGGG